MNDQEQERTHSELEKVWLAELPICSDARFIDILEKADEMPGFNDRARWVHERDYHLTKRLFIALVQAKKGLRA